MLKRRAPQTELELQAMQGGVHNPKRAGLRHAAWFLRNTFASIPGEGEAFITESGKLGRLGPSQMCGSAPHGMRKCHPVTWAGEGLE